MSAALSRVRLQDLLAAIAHCRVGVLGDFTLDGYWYADMSQSELSRETPLYPRPVVQETYSLGGAANVAWNLADLGVQTVPAFSVIGADWRGSLLQTLLQQAGIATQSLVEQSNRVTPFYGKLVLRAPGRAAQEDARLDFINTQALNAESENLLLDSLAQAVPQLDALIVADYQAQGVLTDGVITGLLDLARAHPALPIVVDSRSRASAFRSLILKPNEIEAARLFFPHHPPETVTLEMLMQGALAHQSNNPQPIFITRGAQGCLLCADGRCQLLPGIPADAPVDSVGAGDAFIAALAAALACGAAPREAAQLANLSASVTVRKLGVTGTASPAEVVAQYDHWVQMGM